MNNQLKLSLLVVPALVVGSWLIWKGWPTEVALIQQTSSPMPSPSSAVLSTTNVEATSTAQIAKDQLFDVTRVVDGDTIEIDYFGKKTSVRLVGVNTPETVDPRRPVQCFGKEASDETKHLLTGKKVILEKDISDTDRYGRLLRYIYLPLENGQTLFVDDYLVRQGFAQVSTYPPDVKYQERFLEAQKEAHDNNRGLWSKCK